MSTFHEKSFVCDICGAITKFPLQDKWFKITSLRWEFPKFNAIPDEYPEKHACHRCGERLDRELNFLNLIHEYDESSEGVLGRIFVP